MNSPLPRGAEQPQLKEDTGLICFMDNKRPCGADCMAYLPSPPQSDPELKDQQLAHCLLLLNVHRTGKHLVVLAAQGIELLKHIKNKSADAARSNQPAPPSPTGGR